MEAMPTPTVIMPRPERDALSALVTKLGELAAANSVQVNPVTLARAVAGFGIARTTAAALRAALAPPRPSV